MERERTMRRVLSMLLAVLMLVTSVPMDTVYAEEVTNTGIMTTSQDNLNVQNTNGEEDEPVTQADADEYSITFTGVATTETIKVGKDKDQIDSASAVTESEGAYKYTASGAATYYVKVTTTQENKVVKLTGAGVTDSDNDGIYEVALSEETKSVTVTVKVEDKTESAPETPEEPEEKATFTVTATATSNDYYELTADDVTVKDGENATLTVTATQTDKAIKEGKALSEVKVTINGKTDKFTTGDSNWTYEVKNVTKDTTATITAVVTDKKVAEVTFNRKKVALAEALAPANVVLYRANVDGEYVALSDTDKVYEGDELVVGLDVDYADVTVKVGETTLDEKFTVGYKFTAAAKNEVNVSASLNTKVITFAKGNYTLTIDSVKDGGEFSLATKPYTFVKAGMDDLVVTIKPLNDHYQLVSVNGTKVEDGDEISKTYTVSCELEADKAVEETITVETKRVNNLTITGDTTGIEGVYLSTIDEAKSLLNVEAGVVIPESEDVTLYLKLVTEDGEQDKKTTTFKFHSVDVSVEDGDAVNKVASLESADGKDINDEYLFKLELGKLTGHTKIDARTTKKTGNKVEFEGTDYTVAVGNADADEDDLNYIYSESLPYVDTLAQDAEKTIYLKAAENTRFTKVSAGKDLIVSIADGGKTATITGLTGKFWDAAKNKTISISAEVEKTINVKFAEGNNKEKFDIVVKEDYAYHVDGDGKKDGIVNADETGFYTVSPDSKVTVTATIDSAEKAKYAITSITRKADGKDEAANVDFKFANGTTSVNFNDLADKDTITIHAGLDKTQLKGIVFVKEHYTVTSDSVTAFNVADFSDYDKDLNGILKLAENGINDAVVLEITPEDGYALSNIYYAGKEVKITVNETSTEALADAASTEITATREKDADKVTVTIPAAKFEAGKQKTLEVSTTATKLTENAEDGFTVVKNFEDVYIFGTKAEDQSDETKYFSEDEVDYILSGKYADDDDESDNYYLVEGATYLTFNVTAPSNVDVDLKFYKDANANTEKKNISYDRTANKFKVAAKSLLDVRAVKITAEVKTEDISLTYNKNLVTVSAEGKYKESPVTADAKDAEGKELTDGTVVTTYAVRKGESLDVDVKAITDSADAKKYLAEITEITNVTDVSFPASEASFIVAANESKEVAIKATPVVENEVLDYTQKNALVAEEDGTYTISYGAYYYASVNQGSNKAEVNKAELVVDGKTTEIDVTDNVAKFKVDETAAGKKAVLTLKYVGSKETKDVASFTFHVVNALTKVTVTGPDGEVDKSVTQTIDTKVAYSITVPEGTTVNDLYVEATACDAVIVGDELVITTNAAKAGTATIDLQNNKNGESLKTFTVVTKAVEGVENAAASLSYIASSVDSLMVSLASKDVADVDLVEGCVAYKVELTAQKGSKDPDQSIFYIPRTGETQEATLKVFNAETVKEMSEDSKATDNKYDVTVQLVQLSGKTTKSYTLADNSAKVLYNSETAKGTGEFVIKVPYYAATEEFNLVQSVNLIHRGEELKIADVSFGDKTSYVNANVILRNAKGNAVDETAYSAKVEYNKVYLYASEKLDLGTYDVIVVADAPADAIAASKSMKITVEEGIWKLDLQNVPNTLYKQAEKAASFKAGTVFNGSSKAKVKNNKVTWELFASVKQLSDNEYEFSGTALNGKATVKNGTVSISKDFTVSKNAKENSFVVVATSVGNPDVCAFKEVTVSSQAVELTGSNLVLAKATEYDANGVPSKYAALENQALVGSDLAVSGDLYLIVVTKAGQSTYTVADLMTSSVTAKASNAKLKLTAVGSEGVAYRLDAATTLKNVKITVTSMDGSKKSAQKAFNIDFASVNNMVMRINGVVVNTASYSYAGTSEDVLKVELGYMEGKNFQNFAGVLNTKVTVKNGKILSSDTVNNVYFVKLNKDTASFTVKNKADKTAAALINCTITNTAYNTFAKVNAPAVVTETKSIIANSVDEQKLTYSFKKAADYKFVKVQIDEADKLKVDKKNEAFYEAFVKALGGTSVILPIKDGSFVLTLKEWSPVATGAYKLYFTYGNVDASENFVPATKAGKVNLKAAEAKNAEYTPNTEYTIALLDAAEVELTGTLGKDTTVKYPDGPAYSKIVDGKKNAFADFFEVKGGMLKLREDADETALNKLIGTKLTGYVAYRLNGNVNTKQAEINVTLSKEQVNTYSAEAITMLAGKEVEAIVKVTTANGKEVAVKDAEKVSGSFNFEAVDGKLVMTSTSSAAGESEAVVSIIPSTSFYTEGAKAHGVKVTVKVDAKASFDAKVIDIKAENIEFTSYDGVAKAYIGSLAYTSAVPNKIDSITATNNDLDDLVSFEANGTEIVATVAKEDLADAVKEKVVSYGETKSVEVTVKYSNGYKETHTITVKFPAEESFSEADLQEIFTNIRKAIWGDLEKNPNGNPVKRFPAAVDFKAADAMKAEADKQYAAEEAATELGETADHTESDKLYAEAEALYEKAAKEAVVTAVEKQLVVGADIAVADTTSAEYDEDTNFVTVKVVLNGSHVTKDNTVEDLTSGNYELTTKVAVPEVTDWLAIYKLRLENFAKDVEEYVRPTNSITEDAVVTAATKAVLANASDHFEIIAVEDSWKMTAATSKKKGSFEVTLKVVDTTAEEDVDYKGVVAKADISRLQTISAAAKEFSTKYAEFVAGALAGYTILNADTTSNDILAIAAAVVENTDIKVAWEKEFAFTEKELTLTLKDKKTKKVTVKTGVTGEVSFTDEANGASTTVDIATEFENVNTTNDLYDNWKVSELIEAVKAEIAGNDNAKSLLNNDSEASKANVLRAATQAIENAPYKVVIKEWNWLKQATAEVDGKVSYVVGFEALDGSADVTETISLTQVIVKDNAYQTFEEAVAAIKDDFLKADLKKQTTWFDENDKIKADGVLTSIKASVKDLKQDGADNTRYMTVDYRQVLDKYFTAYGDDITLTDSTVNTEGRLTLTVVLEEIKDGNVINTAEITLNKVIEEKAQTLAQAREAVKSLELTVNANTTKSDVNKAIRKVVKTSDFKYEITSFENTDGKVTFKVKVSLQSVSLDSVDEITVELK